jgi:hypothetical protein
MVRQVEILFFFFYGCLLYFFLIMSIFFRWYMFLINRPRLSLWINVSMNSEKKKKNSIQHSHLFSPSAHLFWRGVLIHYLSRLWSFCFKDAATFWSQVQFKLFCTAEILMLLLFQVVVRHSQCSPCLLELLKTLLDCCVSQFIIIRDSNCGLAFLKYMVENSSIFSVKES